MIHTTDTITIRRYGRIDRTNDLGLLRRWWNPFPVGWFDTDSFFVEVNRILGGKNGEARNEAYKIISYNNILILEAMLNTLGILMNAQNVKSIMKTIFKTSKKNDEIKIGFYIEKIKQKTGIEIKDGKDLERLKKEIKRLSDKYIQRFPQKKEPVKQTDFMEFAMAVFSVMEMSFVPEMKLSEFEQLKKLSDRKIEQLEKIKK